MRSDFGIVDGYNIERNVQLDAQDCVNLYPIYDRQDKKPKALVRSPGLGNPRTLDPVLTNTRAAFYSVSLNQLFIVANNNIYRIDSSFVATIINPGQPINNSPGYVGITENVNQIMFVDGSSGWVYNKNTTTFTEINNVLDPNFPTQPIDIAYQDGYFIIPFGNSNQFGISDLNDGLSWPGNNARFQSRPDQIRALKDLHRRLFIFGDISTEVWIDAGAADFPFRRNNNLLLEYGCANAASIASGYQRIFFLSADENGIGSVMMIQGTQPIPISDDIDIQIQRLTNPKDCQGFVYKIDKGIFYQLNFTTDNLSFVYNVTTGRWNRVTMLDGSRHIANWHVFFQNKNLVGSFNSAQYFEFSPEYKTNDLGDTIESIPRKRITKHFIVPTYNRIRINSLRVDILPGQGIPNTNDEDPEIFLSVSKDGGVTYENPIRAFMGREGNWRKRVIFSNLGVSDVFTFRVETWTQADFMILGASIDYEVLPE